MHLIESNIHKIAVLRANALGDFIFALPALTALRAAYPEAEIVLLAREWHQAFLADRPGPIDRVIAIPPGGIGQETDTPQDPVALQQFFAAMHQEQFDLAIQLHGGGRNSNPFLLQLGARLTIGLKTPDAPSLHRWIPYIYYQPEIARYLEVMALVGVSPQALHPELQVIAADLEEAYRVVPPASSPLVVLHPGATSARRQWPPEKFAAVGDAIASTGVRVVVTGTAPERQLVESVAYHMSAKAENLCDRLSLNGLTGLLSRSQLVISNDSGPLHLAAALGTPTVGLYWCGNLVTAAELLRSHHTPCVSWRLRCPVCDTDCIYDHCNHQASFIADIAVEEVLQAALALLDTQPMRSYAC